MNDQQKIRLAMLAFAGLLLAGGGYAWMSYNNEKQQEADVAENTSSHVHIAARKPEAQAPKSDTADNAATADGAKPKADEGQTPVAAKPEASVPAKSESTAPDKPATLAVRPQPNAPAVKSELDKMPPAVKPAVNIPAPAVAVKPAVAANPNSGMATSFKPMANTVPATNLNVRAAAKPTAVAALPPAALAPVAPTPAAAVAAAAVPAGTGVVATTEAEASTKARKEAGRTNPMLVLTKLLPFPRKGSQGAAAGPGDVPPPPPGSDETAAAAPGEQVANGGIGVKGKIADKLVPPPPPGGDGGGPGDIPIDILPPPPSRPMISDKLQVVSILDDHAIITFPKDMRRQNKWPAFITLGVGEQFDSLKVVAITPDGVTVEEDGERSLKPLPNIK